MALGAAAFASVATEVVPATAGQMMSGIVAGVGFLGIGIISRADEGQSRGLTTAAAIWVVAGLGVLCGVGLYVAAVTCTALVMLVLELDRLPGLRRMHTWLIRRDGNGLTPTPG